MGHIMAVAAEFEIQSDMKQVTMTKPKCKLSKGNHISFISTYGRRLTA